MSGVPGGLRKVFTDLKVEEGVAARPCLVEAESVAFQCLVEVGAAAHRYLEAVVEGD